MKRKLSILIAVLLPFFAQAQSIDELKKHLPIEKVLADRNTRELDIPNNNKKILLLSDDEKTSLVTDAASIKLKNVAYVAKIKHPIPENNRYKDNIPQDHDVYLVEYTFLIKISSSEHNNDQIATFTFDKNKKQGVVTTKDGTTIMVDGSSKFIDLQANEVTLNTDKLLEYAKGRN